MAERAREAGAAGGAPFGARRQKRRRVSGPGGPGPRATPGARAPWGIGAPEAKRHGVRGAVPVSLLQARPWWLWRCMAQRRCGVHTCAPETERGSFGRNCALKEGSLMCVIASEGACVASLEPPLGA